MTDEEIVDLVRMNASSNFGLEKRLRMLEDRVAELEIKNQELRYDIDANCVMAVSRSQRLSIHEAVIERVDYLLDIRYVDGEIDAESKETARRYRPGFINRIYRDAKANVNMGETYDITKAADIDPVLQYVDSWVPEYEGGVEGYKRYLDLRRGEREKRKPEYEYEYE